MYTEVSIDLKTDFYSRYGETTGQLFFERTGMPCVLMDSGSHMLAFSMGCGVRAYGRNCGDVLRIMNSDSNVCYVHFTDSGMGAQILYKQDLQNIDGMKETVDYTVDKLLHRMHRGRSIAQPGGVVAICDRYGSNGYCAYVSHSTARQIPLPLSDVNVMLIRTGKKRLRTDTESIKHFRSSETRRIIAAAEALRECRIEVLFDMVNESERTIEMLFSPPRESVAAIRIAMETDGVFAARICKSGIICFVQKGRTDNAVHSIASEYERRMESPAGIVIVK
ncbi:MAG: hypothetical protein J1G06_01725 [Oscillospiraceae bacterium]|nr:hypothetical protein [Oscillospiraceae bacterium]